MLHTASAAFFNPSFQHGISPLFIVRLSYPSLPYLYIFPDMEGMFEDERVRKRLSQMNEGCIVMQCWDRTHNVDTFCGTSGGVCRFPEDQYPKHVTELSFKQRIPKAAISLTISLIMFYYSSLGVMQVGRMV